MVSRQERDEEVERLRGVLLFKEEAEGAKARSKGDAAAEFVENSLRQSKEREAEMQRQLASLRAQLSAAVEQSLAHELELTAAQQRLREAEAARESLEMEGEGEREREREREFQKGRDAGLEEGRREVLALSARLRESEENVQVQILKSARCSAFI